MRVKTGRELEEAPSGKENITSDTEVNLGVQSGHARNREVGSPERGTSAMTRESMVNEIQVLLWKLDARKLRIVYQFIKTLIG